MRPFETLTLLFAALSLLPFVIRQRRLRWFALAALLAMLLHLLLEGYRWQMLPAYLLVIALSVLSLLSLSGRSLTARLPQRRATIARLVAALLALAWLGLAVALPALLPVPQPLPPTGPYGVGTRTYHLVDESRPERYDDQAAQRELMLQIWYPGQVAADSMRAPFIDRIDVAGPTIARRLNLPPFLLDHLNLVHTHAYADIPVAPGGPYPLLIFSHGLRGLRMQNSSLMQQLASHGYVVAALDHPYAAVLTIFPDDRIVFYSSAVMPPGADVVTSGAELVAVWQEDIAFAYRQIAAWSQQAGHPLQGHVDAERLGLLGHSTGGGAAIQTCAGLAQCQAALALDGWIEPVAETVRSQAYAPDLMLINAPDWLGPQNRAAGERLYAQGQGAGYLLEVADTVHFDYSDIPLMSPITPYLGLSGEIDGQRMVTLLNEYALAFFDQALKGQPAPLLDGASAAYPEVRFAP